MLKKESTETDDHFDGDNGREEYSWDIFDRYGIKVC
jgi:hypothetical protein